jgi:HEAT repeat protein
MLRGDDPEVKGNAAFVLGELGESSAIPMLRRSIGKGLQQASTARRKIVELQLAEAIVKLGAADEIDAIRAALFATPDQAELAALACQMCGTLGDAGALADLLNIVRRTGEFERPPEVRMAAALAIAKIEPGMAPIDVPLRYTTSDRYQVRAQAAQTLAGVAARGGNARAEQDTLPEGAEIDVPVQLARLMADPNPLVQVAAAGGVISLRKGEALARRHEANGQ